MGNHPLPTSSSLSRTSSVPLPSFRRSRAPVGPTNTQRKRSRATAAYTTFATSFQRWATARAHGEGLPLEAAAERRPCPYIWLWGLDMLMRQGLGDLVVLGCRLR